MNKQVVIAFLMAAGIFLGAWWLTNFFPEEFISQTVWMRQIVFKILLAGFSIGVMVAISGKNIAQYGWKKAQPYKKLKVMIPGLVLGGITTILILLTPAKGNPVIKDLNLLQIILVIWIFSSLTEEIFCRGLIQSYLNGYKHIQIRGWSLPVLVAALIFGMMHISILFVEADLITTLITICFTFLLGAYAGKYREMYDSLWPAFWTHAAFNIGGMLTGIIYAIIYFSITGNVLEV